LSSESPASSHSSNDADCFQYQNSRLSCQKHVNFTLLWFVKIINNQQVHIITGHSELFIFTHCVFYLPNIFPWRKWAEDKLACWLRSLPKTLCTLLNFINFVIRIIVQETSCIPKNIFIYFWQAILSAVPDLQCQRIENCSIGPCLHFL